MSENWMSILEGSQPEAILSDALYDLSSKGSELFPYGLRNLAQPKVELGLRANDNSGCMLLQGRPRVALIG